MTRTQKFRKAAQVCWLLGAFFTWSFMRKVLEGSIAEPAVLWVVALGAALATQYVLTLIESKVIDGSLPAPWNIDFKNETNVAIIAIAAYGCFLIDVLLNLGGVYVFTSKLAVAVGEVKQLGISDYIMAVVQFIVTIFLSMLFALGSELLDSMADLEESGRSMHESRRPKREDPKLNQERMRQEAQRQQAIAATQQAKAKQSQPEQEPVLSDQEVLRRLHARKG